MMEPTPTGEWTEKDVARLYAECGFIAITKAHNAALAAERERYNVAQEEIMERGKAMQRLRTELDTERGRGIDTGGLVEAARTIQQLRTELAAERGSKHDVMVKYEAALAAERERYNDLKLVRKVYSIEMVRGMFSESQRELAEAQAANKDLPHESDCRGGDQCKCRGKINPVAALNAAIAAEREKTKQAWQEHDDNVEVMKGLSDTIKQLGAANRQLRDQLDLEKRQCAFESEQREKYRTELAAAQANMLTANKLLVKYGEHQISPDRSALDAYVAEQTRGLVLECKRLTEERDSARKKCGQVQPLVDASSKLANLLKDSYWVQCPIDVAKAADELLAALAQAGKGKV